MSHPKYLVQSLLFGVAWQMAKSFLQLPKREFHPLDLTQFRETAEAIYKCGFCLEYTMKS